MEKQLKTRQVCLFFIAFLPAVKLLKLPSVICSVANEDGWLSALTSLILDFTVLLVLLISCRKTDKTFFELLKDSFGSLIAKTVYLLYAIFFSVKSIIPLSNQRAFNDLTLYTSRPSVIYFLPLFLFFFYLATKKMRVLGRLADVFWIITLSGLCLILALSVGNADFSAILPVGANGAENILSGSLKSLNWFGDCLYFLFFSGNFEKSKNYGLKISLSYFFSGLSFVFFMVVFYGVFTSLSGKQIFALTDIAKYSTVISNTSRFDYIAIFLLTFSNVIGLSLPVFFASYCLNVAIEFKKTFVSPLIITLSVFLLGLLFDYYAVFIENNLKTFLTAVYLLFSSVIPFFSFILTLKKEKPCVLSEQN